MAAWMTEKAAPDGTRLHGAGSGRSEAWWKGLHGVLVAKGMVELKSIQARPGLGIRNRGAWV
jgi:hypothetical protein